MLEFKNTQVRFPDGEQSKPFSLVVDDGDIVCICGGHGAGKSLLMQAVLGLSPISSGFITYDGELITPGSSSYFRAMIAYIPQDMPKDRLTVKELFRKFFNLHVNSCIKVDAKRLMQIWEKIGIDSKMLDIAVASIDAPTLQLIMLSFLYLLDRKVVLIDNIHQYEGMQVLLDALAERGSEVIYTCNENKMKCNKLIEL